MQPMQHMQHMQPMQPMQHMQHMQPLPIHSDAPTLESTGEVLDVGVGIDSSSNSTSINDDSTSMLM
jgi:hypothetical protein